jgi:predicted RNA-binding protein YlqC (UPF0109 family)
MAPSTVNSPSFTRASRIIRTQPTAAQHEEVHQLLDSICRKLVDRPDKIHVEAVEDLVESRTVLTVTAAERDRGQLIGRGGQNAQAVRRLMIAIGALSNWRYDFEIDGAPRNTRSEDRSGQ